jgi:hypothetical protein
MRFVPLLVLCLTLLSATCTPWLDSRLQAVQLTRATTNAAVSLRQEILERDVVANLHRRPADAATWVALAWLSDRRPGASSTAILSWATLLDPVNVNVRAFAERLQRN